ncbi:PilN domain-containing protein [Orenia marismortui]|uniref:Tfp pilus assembly protein PilN n=1 Tax=Orenia marismortui TaxID=46469 RepID=A0A4R8GHQ4_9FIRM|nr:hypothetical protein [Orenia marismortui]TDX45196.1 Tfp pilus assembly protein PilN [Orenia marismortui]
MINFLTDEFFIIERRNNIMFIIALFALVIITFISIKTIDLYLEVKYLANREEIVNQRIAELDQKLAKVNDLKAKTAKIEKRLLEREEMTKNTISIKRIFEELSLLSTPQLYFEKLRLEGDILDVGGIVGDIDYLSLLNRKLYSSDLLDEFYLDEINKGDNRVRFRIKGKLQKGD